MQEFVAALHVVLQKPSKRQKRFRLLTIEKGDKKRRDSGAVANELLARSAMDDKRMQNGDYNVCLFVAGLSECRGCLVPVPLWIQKKQLSVLHLLFESQNKSLTTSELGDKASVREVEVYSLIYTVSSKNN